MSHTTRIDEIVFSDIESLKEAIKELKTSGIRCDLVTDQKPRAYYANQEGMDMEMPYVLKLEDSKYDVGFVYDAQKQGYVARADLFAGAINRVLGAPPKTTENKNQAQIGKLVQSYAIAAATKQWIREGYDVHKITHPGGDVTLQVSGLN